MDTDTNTEQAQEPVDQEQETPEDQGPLHADPRLIFFVGKAAKQPSKSKQAVRVRETTKTD